MGLKNPTGLALAEKYIYLKCPEQKAEIERLNSELDLERSKPPVEVEKPIIREVEKVVYRNDPSLMDKYREMEYKLKEIPKVEKIVEIKEIPVISRVSIINKKYILISGIAGALLGFLLCLIVK